MTTSTIVVQNIPSGTVNIEADVVPGGAVRPASASHLKVSNDDVSTSNPVPVALPPGTTSPFFTRSSTTGSVTSGAYNATFANIGSIDATVMGSALPAGAIVTVKAPEGKLLGDISYNATGTVLLISGVR